MASEKPFVTLLREYRSKTRDALEVFLYSARKLPLLISICSAPPMR
jgi:hypothetical protein